MMLFRSFTLTIAMFWSVFMYAQNFDWVRTMNGSAMDQCYDVVVSSNTGFIYTTGYFTTTADFLTGPDSLIETSLNNCAFVGKYNVYGDLIWLKTLSSPTGKSKGNAIAIDAFDNVIVVGGFDGTVDFDPSDTSETNLTANNLDPFILKLDQDGHFQWVKKMNCSYAVAASGVAVDTSNNIVFCGGYTGTIFFPTQSLSDNDDRAYLCKLDSEGNNIWVNSLEDVPGDCFAGVVRTDAENNYYVTGVYHVSSSSNIGFLQKISSSGDDGWRVELGSPSGVGSISDVSCSPYGIFVCGSFYNQAIIGNVTGSNIVNGNGPNYDALVFKVLQENGSPQWYKRLGASGDDSASAIHTDANGNVYVAGKFKGTVNYANIPQSTITANGTDTYVWKLRYDGVGTGAYILTNPVDDDISPSAVFTATDGAIYVGGSSYGATDFDQDPVDVEEHTSLGLADGFLHRTTDCDAFLQPPTQLVYFCQGDSIEVNGEYYDQPQLLSSEPVISQWGCDSIASFQLSPYPSQDFASYSMCHGDSVILNYGVVFEAGEYVTEFISSHGCDSTYIEIVSWVPASNTFENFSLCQGEVLSIYSENITTSGDYQFYVQNLETTCIDTVSVSVNLLTIDGVVTQQGNSLVAEDMADSYTWLNCDTGENISGATSQTFSPSMNGSYAVVINSEGCELTSSCVDIEIVAVTEIDLSEIEIYPNPANEIGYIRTRGQVIDNVQIFDAAGRAIGRQLLSPVGDNLYALSLKGIPAGMYNLSISLSNQSILVRKLSVN